MASAQPIERRREAVPDIDADRYERLECIGRGSFGDVYRGLDRETKTEVAIKVIDLEDVEDDIEDIHQEVAVLARCRAPNITEYYASVLRPGTTQLLIVMELMAASAADLVDAGPLDEASLAYVLRGVLAALAYLHGQQRVHRDVKAANVLLGLRGDVKISDFGVSGQLTGTLGFRRRTFVGTPYWMAPEVIESSEAGYTETADIWSLGITAFEMATGAPPHADLHPMRVLFLIPKNPAPKLEGPFSAAFRDFVGACLQKDTERRPSSRALLDHEFVAGVAMPPRSLLERLADFAATRRPVAPGALLPEAAAPVPKWDFGGSGGGEGSFAVRALQPRRHVGSLRSHQLAGTLRDDASSLGTLRKGRSSSERVPGVAANDPMGTVRAPGPPSATSPGLPLANGHRAASPAGSPAREPQPPFRATSPGALRQEGVNALAARLQAALAVSSARAGSAAKLPGKPPLSEAALRPGGLHAALAQMLQHVSSEEGARAVAALDAAPAAACQPGTASPQLGALGEFLLARWQDGGRSQGGVTDATPWRDCLR
ncbi:hypothetical protein WJX81_000440 [Elliptochloris bilobata]|uniref:non-specific serine/threonine protein kinase n=1 Tax=Elliptochloris bilobata TaxID=381761 RepID=A0AAW1SC67_9CHLO